MYTCGPTVYDYAHIGNFRAYVFEDILRRYLKFKGYKVIQVMNLTDVDDKTIKGSRTEGVSLAEFTAKYIAAFFEDLDRLGIERAEFYPRATEHIGEMVALVKKLLKKGYAYESGGSIYYDVSKFKEYGKLSGIQLEELKKGARVAADEYIKEEATDFALWKAWEESDGPVFWETELGKGRPGWHIECSAMSMKYLGESFEIHTGGEDNIFPHHENEIAQSEAATGKQFVRYWLHCGLLQVGGQKMSKSLGNIITPRELVAIGTDPRAIRYLLISAHYRTQLNFTAESLKSAEQTVQGLVDFAHKVSQLEVTGRYNKKLQSLTRATRRELIRAMDDDLDTPRALAAIHELVRETNKAIDRGRASQRNLKEIYDQISEFDMVLGIIQHKREKLPPDLLRLIRAREEARLRHDWIAADELRNKLLEQHIALEDTPHGVIWRRIH